MTTDMTETHTVGVTGAAGYIGSRVAKVLLAEGHDVVPVDDFSVGDVREIDGRRVEEVDVRDRDAVREAFDGVDAVMHLGAVSGVPDCQENPEHAFDVNVGGTENVAWFCRERGTPLVFPCSMAVLGDPVEFPITADHPRNPLNFYGRSKALSEDDVHQLADGEFPAHVYVKSNLYGHHELDGREIGKNTVINIFVDKALDGEPLTVHEPGTQARDFIHVKDVARAYALSLDELVGSDPGATTFTLASGDDRSILDIAEAVQSIVADERGYEVPIEMVENPRESETEVGDFTVDTSEARAEIGFEAEYDVDRAVREMVR
ncbi:NAD-dependent epimerase/dehydratase family protein [Halostella litorea]|uniref:NAD-dependent epimerase/dehydratase family protein n=1 Tax=Halostella litorea TaxID=2528831 RepID=UPI001F019DEB|nr:NAD-dependent epimerase/dehydratase family protein [Halostella litorea]